LERIVEWKFKTFPGRKIRILNLISENTEEEIMCVSSKALRSDSDSDLFKMETLCKLKGVGPALASTILTFHDPAHYGVFDIHVCREFFGKTQIVPPTIATYLNVLEKLRMMAKQYGLEVRSVEKAFFKRNLDQ
jgi:endonuclease III